MSIFVQAFVVLIIYYNKCTGLHVRHRKSRERATLHLAVEHDLGQASARIHQRKFYFAFRSSVFVLQDPKVIVKEFWNLILSI